MDRDQDSLEQDGGRAMRWRVQTAPRLGSFVTIAAALLMLFGAASRMGKMPETAALFGLDQREAERIAMTEDRRRAAMSIGGVPVSGNEAYSQIQPSLPVNNAALPPARPEVELDVQRRSVSMARPLNTLPAPTPGSAPMVAPAPAEPRQQIAPTQPVRQYPTETMQANFDAVRQDSVPVQAISFQRTPAPATQPRPDSYTVASGDTWVKIAKATLGDANRWRDIQRANPNAQNGLQVGMKLRIPH